MPKIKNSQTKNKKITKNEWFSQELFGIFLLIIGLAAISRLGKLGFYLYLFCKFLFGDFYFLSLAILIFLGIYYLFIRDHVGLSHIRFVGVVLISLVLMMFSHFSVHDYLKQYNTPIIKDTCSIYLNALKTRSPKDLAGGGMVGMFLFYAIYSLLSRTGVLLLGILLFFIGISFLFKKTLKEIFKALFKMFKKILLWFNHFVKKGIKEVKALKNEFNQIDKIKLPKNFVEVINPNLEDYLKIDSFVELTKTKIEGILKNNHIMYESINALVSVPLVRFEVKVNTPIFLKEFYKEMDDNFIESFALKKIDETNNFIIEFLNPNLNRLSLAFFKNYYLFLNEEEILLTIDDLNEPILLGDENKTACIFSTNFYYLYFLVFTLGEFKNEKFYIINETSNDLFIKKYYPFHSSIEVEELINKKRNKEDDLPITLFFVLDENTNIDVVKKIYYFMETTKTLAPGIKYIIYTTSYQYHIPYFYESFDYLLNIDSNEEKILSLFSFESTENVNIGETMLCKHKQLIFRAAVCAFQKKELEKLGL